MPLQSQVDQTKLNAELDLNPVYVQEGTCEIPVYRLGQDGVQPATALQIVRDELILDGNARLNLATFVTTWMEPEAQTLMAECFDKNMIDKDEYPQTAELERRCVNILSDLWNAPAGSGATGCSTTGSSEACMLGGVGLVGGWRGRPRGWTAAGPTWSWARTCRCAGRSSAGTGRSSRSWCRWCRGGCTCAARR